MSGYRSSERQTAALSRSKASRSSFFTAAEPHRRYSPTTRSPRRSICPTHFWMMRGTWPGGCSRSTSSGRGSPKTRGSAVSGASCCSDRVSLAYSSPWGSRRTASCWAWHPRKTVGSSTVPWAQGLCRRTPGSHASTRARSSRAASSSRWKVWSSRRKSGPPRSGPVRARATPSTCSRQQRSLGVAPGADRSPPSPYRCRLRRPQSAAGGARADGPTS